MAEKLAPQVWAILRRGRSTQLLSSTGAWVPGVDENGLATLVWQAGTEYEDLTYLIGLCLQRVTAAAVLDLVAASVTESAHNPLRVLCKRLWDLVRRLDPVDQRPDCSKPAVYVQAEEDLRVADLERGRRDRGRVDERKAAAPGAVPVVESAAAADWRTARAERPTAPASAGVFDEALDLAAGQVARLAEPGAANPGTIAGSANATSPGAVHQAERTAAERERTEQLAHERADRERGRGRLQDRLAEIEARTARPAAPVRPTLLERAERILGDHAPDAEPIQVQDPALVQPAPAGLLPSLAGQDPDQVPLVRRAERILGDHAPDAEPIRNAVPKPTPRKQDPRLDFGRLAEIEARMAEAARRVAEDRPAGAGPGA